MRQSFRLPWEEALGAEQHIVQFFQTRTLLPDAIIHGRGRFLLAAYERWLSKGGWGKQSNKQMWNLFSREINAHYGSFQHAIKGRYPFSFGDGVRFLVTLLLHWDKDEKGWKTFRNYPESTVREVGALLAAAVYGSVKNLQLLPEPDGICWLDDETLRNNWENLILAIGRERWIPLHVCDESRLSRRTIEVYPLSVENGCGELRESASNQVILILGILRVASPLMRRKVKILYEIK